MAFGILLILFVAAEVAFAVRARKAQATKADWLRDRLVLRGTELAVALVARLVPAFGENWRFSLLVGMAGLLFACALVSYFVRRKKVTGTRKLGAAIAGPIFTVLALAIAAVPALVFTGYKGMPNTGSYQVAQAHAILVDPSRLEEFETGGSHREVPAYFYYPDDASSEGSHQYPLVVFDHGSFGYHESNFSTYTELASNGYVVVVVEHPYYSLFSTDTAGQTIPVDMDFMNDVMTVSNAEGDTSVTDAQYAKVISEWMTLRDADMNFALDSLKTAADSGTLDDTWHVDSDDERAGVLRALGMTDTQKIGLMGHSIGGAVSMDMARQRDDISAVIDIDGTMLGEEKADGSKFAYNPEPFQVPLLALNNEVHGRGYATGNADGSEYVNQYVVERAKDARVMSFGGTEHMDFTDLPLLSPFLANMLGSGDVDHEQFMVKLNGIVLQWFDYYLKGTGDLSGIG